MSEANSEKKLYLVTRRIQRNRAHTARNSNGEYFHAPAEVVEIDVCERELPPNARMLTREQVEKFWKDSLLECIQGYDWGPNWFELGKRLDELFGETNNA